MLQERSLKLFANCATLRSLVLTLCLLCSGFCVSLWSCTSPAEPQYYNDNYIQPSDTQDTNDNLWSVLQQSFDIPQAIQDQPAVQDQIHWFLVHQSYLYGVAKRASPYLYYIYQQTQTRKLPPALILLPFVESAYNPSVYSQRGAAGLWQIMPGTGAGFGIKHDFWYDGRRDIVSSTSAALDYLSYLDNYFGGDWLLALAAYDSGEGTVDAAIRKNEAEGKPTNFWALDLPTETKLYVPRIVALATIISNPDQYPIRLPYVKAQPYLAQVDTGAQIDLAQAAALAGISVAELYQLNPGYQRGTTDPEGPNRLVLPITHISEFEAHLAERPRSQQFSTQYYVVKPGDTVGGIAKKFHTHIQSIVLENHLHHDLIHSGEKLQVPGVTHTIVDAPSSKPYLVTPATHSNNDSIVAQGHPQQGTVFMLTYSVRKGDSIDSIAHSFHVRSKDIEKWNPLANNSTLQPGQVLKIYTAAPPA